MSSGLDITCLQKLVSVTGNNMKRTLLVQVRRNNSFKQNYPRKHLKNKRIDILKVVYYLLVLNKCLSVTNED